MIKMDLNKGWAVRYEELYCTAEYEKEVLAKENGWLKVDAPFDVHMPLVENGILPDPSVGDNSEKGRWVENKSWWCKKEFEVTAEIINSNRIEITFESLDSEADIFLNGRFLGHQKSSFYPFTSNIKEFLQEGRNQLAVRLTTGVEYVSQAELSPLEKCISEIREEYPGTVWTNRGDKRRVFVRKAQYSFGWDWGPRVPSCGILKDVYIQAFDELRINSVYAVTRSVDSSALIEFKLEIENFHPYSSLDGIIKLEIVGPCGNIVYEMEQEVFVRSGISYPFFSIDIPEPMLWWPNGMGGQPLYTTKVSVATGSSQTCYPPFRFGIRTLKLNLNKLNAKERLFAFEINGEKVFCKGANWAPADSILPRITDEKYERLIMEARNANFNMLRVWGGGIYEKPVFYEKCDEFGILVWQDFMFACALYPDHLDWFRDIVGKEMDYQTKVLRNHPSMALWCGCNENFWFFDRRYIGDVQPPFLGGTRCYNEIAPRMVQQNCPEIPYWNGSSYGGEHPNENDAGDTHHWDECTMSPEMEKRITPEEYDKVNPKFVSEYGYIGPCSKSSTEKYMGDSELDRQNRVWVLHSNTFEKDTVEAGIAKHYRSLEQLTADQYLLYGGLCQGLMLQYSLESFRSKPDCWGGLFWMFSDCWGEIGWSIVDYYTKRKISYYYVKRAFEPVKLILRKETGKAVVTSINESGTDIDFEAEFGYTSFDGIIRETGKTSLQLPAYSRCQVLEFPIGEHDTDTGLYFIKPLSPKRAVRPAILREKAFRELMVSTPEITITDFSSDNMTARFVVVCDCYAHAVHFKLDEGMELSDEYFDLLPGESREINVWLNGKVLTKENVRGYCIA